MVLSNTVFKNVLKCINKTAFQTSSIETKLLSEHFCIDFEETDCKSKWSFVKTVVMMTKWFHDKFHHLTCCKVKKNCFARSADAVFLEHSSVANVISIFRPKNPQSS